MTDDVPQAVFILFVERFGVTSSTLPRFGSGIERDPSHRDRVFITAGTVEEVQALQYRLFDHALIWRSTIVCDSPAEVPPGGDENGRLLLDALGHRERLVADALAGARR